MSHNFINMVGKRFGRLEVISRAPNDKGNRARWICRCDCGNVKEIDGYHLRKGITKSCGCYAKEKSAESQAIRDHGDKKPYKDLAGKRFGRLIAVKFVQDAASAKVPTRWNCICDCGAEVIVRGSNLLSGRTKSCGCLALEKQRSYYKTHGQSGSRLYHIWSNMRSRCYNHKTKAYRNYGGRGISVCKEWDSFELFYDWAMQSGYEDTLTLDRINVDGDYEPNNCRWTTFAEQQRNKQNTVRVLFRGEVKSVGEWAEDLGCKHYEVFKRILELEGRIS